MDKPRGEIGSNAVRAAGLKLAGVNAFASVEHRISGRRVRIGSGAGNDLILGHKSVAPRHAIIRNTRRGCYVRDLGSDTGTFLNGQRIAREEVACPGDELRFGAARFVMVAGAPAASTSSIARYVGAALGLIALATAGYLGASFVRNWESLEQLASTTTAQTKPPPAAMVKPRAAEISAPPPPEISASHLKPVPSASEVRPVVAGPPPMWLAAINAYRAEVKLPPVTEDPKLSDADRKHATYVVKNYEDKVSVGHLIGAEMHDEQKGNRWFTPEGQDAGAKSDINQLFGYVTPSSPRWALDNWMMGPFHRLWILNPRLRRVGYGEFCEKRYCVAALDLGSGAAPAAGPASQASPIVFPADKSITTLNSLNGEWPNPLTACAGFSAPAGLPATIALGAMVDAKLSEYQLMRDGHGVESCGVDADTYQNPVAAEQERGRAILREQGAAMLIPRYPLVAGHYTASATLNDHAYQWSFIIAPGKGSPPLPHEEAAATLKSERADADFEGKRRAAVEQVAKADAAEREEYERYVTQMKKVRAAVVAANALKLREFQRRSESAFPDGPGSIAKVGKAQWLIELNRDRAAVDSPPVVEDPLLSEADLKHARYLATNYPARTPGSAEMHDEDPAKPGYTPEGRQAAKKSNVAPYWFPPSKVTPPPPTPPFFVNGWLSAPFHRPSLINPGLPKVGFGEDCVDHACGAALDALTSMAPLRGSQPLAQPILFPPQSYAIAMIGLENEWPNPIAGCAGYQFPVGLPISIELGTNYDSKLSAYAITQGSTSVEACGYDWQTYTSPNAVELKRARDVMHAFGEVVVVPRHPLTRGATYEVSATVNDHPYRWSFTVSK